jgi:pyridoxine 4-dehydrogenase
MVDLCEQEGLVFLPWAPIQDADQITPIRTAARRRQVSPRQIAHAWLLARSVQILPIPGSGSPKHVAENIAAASVELTSEETTAIFNSV